MIFSIDSAQLKAVRTELMATLTRVLSEADMVGSNKVLVVADHPTLAGYCEPVIEQDDGRFVFRGWRQGFTSLLAVQMDDEMAIEAREHT